MVSIYSYSHGWNEEGKPNFQCSACGEGRKKMLGCGYGDYPKNKLVSGKHDTQGICPGWWRTQDFILDLVFLRKHVGNLGHPQKWPNKLCEALIFLESYEAEAEAKLDEVRKRKAKAKK